MAVTDLDSGRLKSIDALRAVAVLLMTVDHVRDGLHPSADWLRTPMQLEDVTVSLFLTRFITHFCAPIFILLAGMSIALMEIKRNYPKRTLATFLAKRGLILIAIDITVVRFAFSLVFDYSYLENLKFSVLTAIGFGLVAMVLMIYWPLRVTGAVAALLVLGHNLLDSLHIRQTSSLQVIWSFLHEPRLFNLSNGWRIGVSYPLLPWVGVTAIGYFLGHQLYGHSTTSDQRVSRLVRWGVSSLILFLLLRLSNFYGETSTFVRKETWTHTMMSLVNLTKYPPSALYLLLTLGISLIALAGLERYPVRILHWLTVFGAVPLFFYVVHLYVIELVQRLLAWSFRLPAIFDVPSLGMIWLISFVVAALMYPASVSYLALKRKTRWRVLNYL